VIPIMGRVKSGEAPVEPWVDDHQECEPGSVHGHLGHARVAWTPSLGNYVVVGDDEAPPILRR